MTENFQDMLLIVRPNFGNRQVPPELYGQQHETMGLSRYACELIANALALDISGIVAEAEQTRMEEAAWPSQQHDDAGNASNLTATNSPMDGVRRIASWLARRFGE